jgi:hypothetical protein
MLRVCNQFEVAGRRKHQANERRVERQIEMLIHFCAPAIIGNDSECFVLKPLTV